MQNLSLREFIASRKENILKFLILNCHFEFCILHFEFERVPSGSEARAHGRGAFAVL